MGKEKRKRRMKREAAEKALESPCLDVQAAAGKALKSLRMLSLRLLDVQATVVKALKSIYSDNSVTHGSLLGLQSKGPLARSKPLQVDGPLHTQKYVIPRRSVEVPINAFDFIPKLFDEDSTADSHNPEEKVKDQSSDVVNDMAEHMKPLPSVEDCLDKFLDHLIGYKKCSRVDDEVLETNGTSKSEPSIASTNVNAAVGGDKMEMSDRKTCPSEPIKAFDFILKLFDEDSTADSRNPEEKEKDQRSDAVHDMVEHMKSLPSVEDCLNTFLDHLIGYKKCSRVDAEVLEINGTSKSEPFIASTNVNAAVAGDKMEMSDRKTCPSERSSDFSSLSVKSSSWQPYRSDSDNQFMLSEEIYSEEVTSAKSRGEMDLTSCSTTSGKAAPCCLTNDEQDLTSCSKTSGKAAPCCLTNDEQTELQSGQDVQDASTPKHGLTDRMNCSKVAAELPEINGSRNVELIMESTNVIASRQSYRSDSHHRAAVSDDTTEIVPGTSYKNLASCNTAKEKAESQKGVQEAVFDGLQTENIIGSQLFVKTLGGTTLSVQIELTKTSEDLECLVEKLSTFSQSEQYLEYQGRILKHKYKLSDQGISQDSTIVICSRICGGRVPLTQVPLDHLLQWKEIPGRVDNELECTDLGFKILRGAIRSAVESINYGRCWTGTLGLEDFDVENEEVYANRPATVNCSPGLIRSNLQDLATSIESHFSYDGKWPAYLENLIQRLRNSTVVWNKQARRHRLCWVYRLVLLFHFAGLPSMCRANIVYQLKIFFDRLDQNGKRLFKEALKRCRLNGGWFRSVSTDSVVMITFRKSIYMNTRITPFFLSRNYFTHSFHNSWANGSLLHNCDSGLEILLSLCLGDYLADLIDELLKSFDLYDLLRECCPGMD